MDRVQNELYKLCADFILILDQLKKSEEISMTEYENHTKLKKLFIHQEKSKLFA